VKKNNEAVKNEFLTMKFGRKSGRCNLRRFLKNPGKESFIPKNWKGVYSMSKTKITFWG